MDQHGRVVVDEDLRGPGLPKRGAPPGARLRDGAEGTWHRCETRPRERRRDGAVAVGNPAEAWPAPSSPRTRW